MERAEILEQIKARLGEKIVDFFEKSERRYYIEVAPDDVPAAARLLFEELGARFQTASGIDTPDCIEILYHWAFDANNFLLTLKTRLDRDKPEIDSLASICVATEWIEREMLELLGIKFRNHPDLRHLLLMDDWPEGKYPLRRDYVRE